MLPQFAAKGAALAAIGNGNIAQARSFFAEKHLQFPLYTDPGLKAYTAAGFLKDMFALVKPSAVRNAMRAYNSGYRQTALQGDAMQLGGVLVIAPGGRLLFRQASTTAGDHARPEDILQSLG